MDFKDVLEDVRAKGRTCKVVFLLDKLNPQDRQDAEEALEYGSPYSGATLARAITQMTGEPLSSGAVNNHRKGACPCRS